ncbi:hypothetical protein RHDC4_00930 [Rhodocyclaceae bacterium]|nr:hypothetical protein RHDC4_00930 [Rhodocyclaceae bacterium]
MQVQAIQLPPVPVMEWVRFAESVGLPPDVIRGMLDKEHLPSIKIGKRRFVNLVLLTQMCLAEAGE